MKLFASDFDGTLCFNGKVSEKNIKAIREWRAAGNLFIVVTGRSFPSIKKALIQDGIEVDYIATNNGGFMWDHNYELLDETYFDISSARELLVDLIETTSTHLVMNDGENRKLIKIRDFDKSRLNIVTEEISVEDALKEEKIAQIVAWGISDEESMKLEKYINDSFEACSAFRNVGCIDIVPRGISKAVGVEYVRSKHNIDHDDVYTAGDANNDLPMLLEYQGMTLQSAHESIKEQVSEIYEDVADKINELLL